jgi:hypothetical protein
MNFVMQVNLEAFGVWEKGDYIAVPLVCALNNVKL